MVQLVNKIIKQPECVHFKAPVDIDKLKCPDYYDVIQKPADFGTIKLKLTSSPYNTIAEVLQDCLLVFSNCFFYNFEPTHVH